MLELKSVADAEVAGKRVLVRVDFNVPLEDGKIVDDTRIKAAVPTIELLHARGAAEIILMSHLGRPKGVDEALRTAPLAARLKELTQAPFTMLENVRFDAREDANDESYAKELAAHGDLFVNDAFAVCHRAAASVVGVTKFLPSFAGLLVINEVTQLTAALMPPKGSVAIIGGAKFETKIPLLTKLLPLYERIMLGGALGNDILKARGSPVGKSLVSEVPVPENIAGEDRVISVIDLAVLDTETNMGRSTVTNDTRIGEKIVDVGPQTAEAWAKEVAAAPFVLWNGPLGIYEDGFTDGTDTVAAALAASPAHAVVGGGDTIAALSKVKFDPSKVFLSTGGGAMLDFLAEGTLPGIEVLKK